jgi:hypothetical protein
MIVLLVVMMVIMVAGADEKKEAPRIRFTFGTRGKTSHQ